MNKKILKQVKDHVKSVMGDELAHDFKHVERVKNWALQIAKKECYEDLVMVEISALMHDIGLTQAEKRSMHGEVGAEMAAKFLDNVLEQQKIVEICNAIKYHNKNREGEGKLLTILRDADMMDLFGAVGVMRAFVSKSSKQEYDIADVKSETWQMKAVDFDRRLDNGVGIGNFIVDQINFQISCYDNLSTESAKQFARPLVKFMKDYIKQLDIEIKAGLNNV